MFILIDGVKYILKNPNSEADLEKVVEKNYKYIFGDNSFYFNFKRKVKSKSGIGSIPDGYLIIFNNIPEWYILEVELASHPLYDHIIPQLTKFNRAIEEISTKKALVDMFYDEIKTDLVLEANIKNKIGSGEIYKFISDLISVKPKIIIVINERTSELNEVTKELRGDIKILEFKIFRRECISEEVDAYLFNSVIDFKNIEKPPIPPVEPPEQGGTTPSKMKIESNTYKIRNSYDILVNTAEWLIKKGKLKKENCPIVSGHKRNLVNINPIHRNGGNFRASKRLSNGLFIETHYSTGSCKTNARKLLGRCGYSENILELKD
jgi:hypothetical protein